MHSNVHRTQVYFLSSGLLRSFFFSVFVLLAQGFYPHLALSALSEDLTFSGEFRHESAYRVVKPVAFTKALNLIRFEAVYSPSSAFRLTAKLRGFYDAVYDFQRIDNIAPRNDPRTILSADLTEAELNALKIDNLRGVSIRQKETEIRELYIDFGGQMLDFRIGRQIIRWGVLEGARITDEINPLDFQEFILRGIQDRYIPLWMAKANLYIGETRTEFLWIPDIEPHKPAAPGSEWEQLQSLENLDVPPQTFLNSEWALKVDTRLGQWDSSFSYFYHWDDFPTAFRTFFDLGEFGLSPEVNFNPRLTRIHSFGTAFSNNFSNFVFNTEIAYIIGKRFGTRFGRFNEVDGSFTPDDNLELELGEKTRDYVKYGLGADFTLLGLNMTVMAQQQYIIGYASDIIQDEFDTVYSLFVNK
ncbi:hypothetical protein MNBD_NITROSPIRAE01-2038, partial [hydrothermal vent metagenome]